MKKYLNIQYNEVEKRWEHFNDYNELLRYSVDGKSWVEVRNETK